MLTPMGLTLNFVGAIVLLGTDVKLIEHGIQRIDPVHQVYVKGLNRIINESIDEELVEDKRAHPYDGIVSGDHWSWWPLSRFLDRHIEQDIPSEDETEIDIQGGWFKIDGEKTSFPEERLVQVAENENLRTDGGSLEAVYGLLYEARRRRIYIYGVGMLAVGFLLQLINSV